MVNTISTHFFSVYVKSVIDRNEPHGRSPAFFCMCMAVFICCCGTTHNDCDRLKEIQFFAPILESGSILPDLNSLESKTTVIITFLSISQYAYCICTGAPFHFLEVSCNSYNLGKNTKVVLQFSSITCVFQSDVPSIRKWWCVQLMERFCVEG